MGPPLGATTQLPEDLALAKAGYPPRRSERTVLYQVVADHLETFLLAHGFYRLRCPQCGKDLLLPFSSKGRGVCPSCQARRMYETTALLNDTLDESPPASRRHLH